MRLPIILTVVSFAVSWAVSTKLLVAINKPAKQEVEQVQERNQPEASSQLLAASTVGRPVQPIRVKEIGRTGRKSLLTNTKPIDISNISDLDMAILNDPDPSRNKAVILKEALVLATRDTLTKHKKECKQWKPNQPATISVKMTVESSENEALVKSIDNMAVSEGAPVSQEFMNCLGDSYKKMIGESVFPKTKKKFGLFSGSAELKVSLCGSE